MSKMTEKDVMRDVDEDLALTKQRDNAIQKINARRKREGLPPVEVEVAKPDTSLTLEIFSDSDNSGAEKKVDAKAAMQRIQEMVTLLKLAQESVDRTDKDLKKAKADAWRIESVDLPELLRETGFAEVSLEDGTKVKLVDEIDCGISEARRADAHKWLRDNNFGAAIKTLVTVSFGKDEVAKADKLFLQLFKKFGDAVEQKESVHASTLKSLLKEMIEKGTQFPLELFGVHPYSIAKLSTKKEKKGL